MTESMSYPRRGIMLDTGHLMITEPAIADEDEGADYILRLSAAAAQINALRG